MIFVSYSWTEQYPDSTVLSFVEDLRLNGYDATCDVMYIQQETAINFTEMMANALFKADKVIIVLSRKYKEKADGFIGGVGDEYRYIISDIKEKKQKYILVSFEINYNEVLPDFLKGREVVFINSYDTNLDSKYGKLFHRINNQNDYIFSPVNKSKTIVPGQYVANTGKYLSRLSPVIEKLCWIFIFDHNGQILLKRNDDNQSINANLYDKCFEIIFDDNFIEQDDHLAIKKKVINGFFGGDSKYIKVNLEKILFLGDYWNNRDIILFDKECALYRTNIFHNQIIMRKRIMPDRSIEKTRCLIYVYFCIMYKDFNVFQTLIQNTLWCLPRNMEKYNSEGLVLFEQKSDTINNIRLTNELEYLMDSQSWDIVLDFSDKIRL